MALIAFAKTATLEKKEKKNRGASLFTSHSRCYGSDGKVSPQREIQRACHIDHKHTNTGRGRELDGGRVIFLGGGVNGK